MSARSSGCMVWGLFLVSMALNVFFLTGCMSPYADALKALAGEEAGGRGVNPFTASSDAKRLRSLVENRLHEGDKGEKIKDAYAKGRKDGEGIGRGAVQVECITRLSKIAKAEMDVRGDDALDKAFAAVEQMIDALEKDHADEAARPRRLMRDIASKLGVAVNDKMGMNDLHSRIVGAIEVEANVPKPMPADEIKAALKETTWKKEFGDYHELVKRLSGKRVIVVPVAQ